MPYRMIPGKASAIARLYRPCGITAMPSVSQDNVP